MQLRDARELALSLVTAGAVESEPLDKALGRVLAEPLFSSRNIPTESRSRLDGFAIVSRDAFRASEYNPIVLAVRKETLAAGHSAGHVALSTGDCARILTGAPMPGNADSVVAREDVVEEEGRIILRRPVPTGNGVTPAGADIRRSELLLDANCLLSPSRLALVASLGISEVSVYCKPRVALLGTGDELIELGEDVAHRPVSICNNRHLLSWLVRMQGGEAITMGIAGDDPKTIADRLQQTNADFIITTGGTGEGERDFIRQAWELLGVRTCFRSLDLSPGRHSALGVRENQVLVALSGNPWAARVVFQELVSPMLWRRQGMEWSGFPVIRAQLEGPVRKREGIRKVVHGRLDLGCVPALFTPIRMDNVSLYSVIRDRLAYCLIDSQRSGAEQGDIVEVRLHDLPILALPHLASGEGCAGSSAIGPK